MNEQLCSLQPNVHNQCFLSPTPAQIKHTQGLWKPIPLLLTFFHNKKPHSYDQGSFVTQAERWINNIPFCSRMFPKAGSIPPCVLTNSFPALCVHPTKTEAHLHQQCAQRHSTPPPGWSPHLQTAFLPHASPNQSESLLSMLPAAVAESAGRTRRE
jgi:hypothetical protein